MPDRLHIALDFDDTLLATRQTLVTILNRLHGTSHDASALSDRALKSAYNCTDEFIRDTFTANFDELHAIDPFPGVTDTLRRASALGHRLTIITARPDIHMPPLYPWLQRHRIHIDHVISAPGQTEKARHAVEQKIDLFVEDSPKHALTVGEKGIPVLLVDYIYNRDCTHPNITRVQNWTEIARCLLPTVKHDVARCS